MKNLFFLLVSILFFSCTTEKNTVVHRTFHNLHAKYNGFFNANEIIKSTYNKFASERTEDYIELLPIYPLPDKDESKMVFSYGYSCRKMRTSDFQTSDAPFQKRKIKK